MTINKTPKMGRPKVPEGQAKSVVLQFRVSEGQLKQIEKTASLAGKTGPVWARDIVLAAAKSD
jgi:hypothetical protein